MDQQSIALCFYGETHLRSWYALAIRSQKEASIVEDLGELRIECFYPQRIVWRKRAGRPRERRSSPLLPGYLFVRVNLGIISVMSIRNIRGVWGFLGVKNEPVPIPDSELELLMAANSRGDHDETFAIAARAIRSLMVGEDVFLTEGPFEGHVMHINDIQAKQVRGEVTIFGTKTPITVPIDKLVKAI